MDDLMKASEKTAVPAPPNLFAALLAGFDAIAGKVSLILFPLGLDLFIWLGPQLRLRQMIDKIIEQLTVMAQTGAPQSAESLQASQEVWALISERLNIMATLRTYPVGVPSLMAGRLPIETPALIQPFVVDLASPFSAVVFWAILSGIGIIIGSIYFDVVARTVLPVSYRGHSAWHAWPRTTLQVFFLTLIWAIIFMAVSIPSICLISAMALANPSLGRFALLLYAGGMIWLIFPLLLSPHGIFVNRNNALASLKRGAQITRLTLPTTALFFLIALILSYGLDILWKIPPENSWFTLIGVVGHAFVTTGLLAASFIYYRDADLFCQKLISHMSMIASNSSRV
jgi:hypothetical protein